MFRGRRLFTALANRDSTQTENLVASWAHLAQTAFEKSVRSLRKAKLQRLAKIYYKEARPKITALQIAAETLEIENARILLEAGADANAGSQCYYPLHIAVEKGQLDLCRLLIEYGADVNAGSARFGAPLHIAAQQDNAEICQFPLRNGADVNNSSLSPHRVTLEPVVPGLTPLHVAAHELACETMKALLAGGADVNAVCRYNTSLSSLESSPLGRAHYAYVGSGTYWIRERSEKRRRAMELLREGGAEFTAQEQKAISAPRSLSRETERRLEEMACRTGNHQWKIAGHSYQVSRGQAYNFKIAWVCKRCGKQQT